MNTSILMAGVVSALCIFLTGLWCVKVTPQRAAERWPADYEDRLIGLRKIGKIAMWSAPAIFGFWVFLALGGGSQ